MTGREAREPIWLRQMVISCFGREVRSLFEIVSYEDAASCVLCEKDANLVVKCKAGTLVGALCTKCLLRQAKARQSVKREPSLPFADRA